MPRHHTMDFRKKVFIMHDQEYPSKLLEEAVTAFASLPGVGRKTALRYVLSLLRLDENTVKHFGEIIQQLHEKISYCRNCYNLSDTELCTICRNPLRESNILCVVENIRDVMMFERTRDYKGVYHVLGGIINPLEGIGPTDLTVQQLVERVKKGEVQEIILALPTTMEGDTTNFYIYRTLKDVNISITTLARGVAVGNELEYTDEVTLARSLQNRQPFESTL